MITYVTYRLAAFLSRSLPPRTSYGVAVRLADVFHRLDAVGREAVMRNLDIVLRASGQTPTRGELRRLSRRTFHHFGKYLVDFFRYSRSSGQDVAGIVRLEHPEYMRAAADVGKGVLVVSAHVGSWELGGLLVSRLGYRLNAVALPQRLENVNRFFQQQRENRGMHVLPLGHAAAGILGCLRGGEWVALLADRDFSPHSAIVPLFGRPARLPRGPAHLCARTGAPILPGFVARQDDDTFLLRWFPPIIPAGGMSPQDVQDRICRILEEVIGQHPAQWFMFRDFWTNGKAGELNGRRAATETADTWN
jgi:KDO2-lipid IV(A) lauroyltransferase